ncbi:MAG: hypothetical protein A3K18_15165 [Lentisphaerae bacterium RIFOXYA12_64_32]|nr:MAG: hypothetical protein A3K18_15165 [Lentisphaerae bacterium RIFOXYA12_64_32]
MPKIGIIGDIHANLIALQSVLDVLDKEGCLSLVCTGDIVGYGPAPADCIRLVRERKIACVLGNHDHYVTMIMDPRVEELREDIRTTVKWTQNLLAMNDLKWLAQLPVQLDLEHFSVVHGAFGPKRWTYLKNESSLAYNFEHQKVALAFCGHSHVPLISYPRDAAPPHLTYFRTKTKIDKPKTIINVGAVGQPRDHDPRAACGVFDTDERTVRPIRVPYDIVKCQTLMRELSLPAAFIDRLSEGR